MGERGESGGTIIEAFAAPRRIPLEYKSMIAVGDEAGRLEQSFDNVSRRTAEDVEHRMRLLGRILRRVVSFVVVLSLVGTLQGLILSFSRG